MAIQWTDRHYKHGSCHTGNRDAPRSVSKVIYGDSNKVDYLMKFNGISNPFSIYAGQVIIAGDPDNYQTV